MAKKPKKGIYCQSCDGLVTIARKGKKRWFICENCGVLAHNPLPALAIAGARLIGSKLLSKGIQKVAQNQEGDGAPNITNRSNRPSLNNEIIMREVYGRKR